MTVLIAKTTGRARAYAAQHRIKPARIITEQGQSHLGCVLRPEDVIWVDYPSTFSLVFHDSLIPCFTKLGGAS